MSVAAVLTIVVNAQAGQALATLSRVDAASKKTAASATASGTAMERAYGRRGAMVAKGGLAAIAGALYASTKVGMEFEKQMSALEAVTGSSGRQMQQFKQQALDAAEGTIFGAREVAQAQTELAKGGLTAKQILGGALPAALDLAAAGEMDLAQAATTTVNAMKLFNLRGSQSGQVADMLATAANSTTAEVSDFAVALTQGGSAAKQVGFSLNDTIVVLEALAEAGIKNSDAGTSMKTALLQLVAPTEKQARLASQLGLEFTNQAGEMKSPIKLAGDLQRALGGMTKAQRTAAMKVLAGTDGFRTLAALFDLGAKRAEKLADKNREVGTAAETASEKTDNLAGDLERLKGTLETEGIKLFDDLGPALRDLTKLATAAVPIAADFAGSFGKELGEFDFESIIDPTGANRAGKAFADQFFGGFEDQKEIESFGSKLSNALGGAMAPGLQKSISTLNRFANQKAVARISVQGGPQATKQIASLSQQAARLGAKKQVVKILADEGSARKKIAALKALVEQIKDKRFGVDVKDRASSTLRTVNAELNQVRDKTVTVTTVYQTRGPRPGSRARGDDNFRGGAAIINERGAEMAKLGNAWWMLGNGKAGAQLDYVPQGTQIFTAAETRALLSAGIPGFAKGKKGKKKPAFKPAGIQAEAILAQAELTPELTDDIAAVNGLIAYWTNQASKYSKPVRGPKGTRGRAMQWDKLTEARNNIKQYQDKLKELMGGTDSASSATGNESAAYLREMLNAANLRYLVSQAQYGVLKGGLPPFAGSFAKGGIVPGPAGAPRMAMVHGGEPIGEGAVKVIVNGDIVGTPRGKDPVEVLLNDRRFKRAVADVRMPSVGRTPGQAGVR